MNIFYYLLIVGNTLSADWFHYLVGVVISIGLYFSFKKKVNQFILYILGTIPPIAVDWVGDLFRKWWTSPMNSYLLAPEYIKFWVLVGGVFLVLFIYGLVCITIMMVNSFKKG